MFSITKLKKVYAARNNLWRPAKNRCARYVLVMRPMAAKCAESEVKRSQTGFRGGRHLERGDALHDFNPEVCFRRKRSCYCATPDSVLDSDCRQMRGGRMALQGTAEMK